MKFKIIGGILAFICFVMMFIFMAFDLKYPNTIYSTLRGICAVIAMIGIMPLGLQLYDVMGGPWIVRFLKRRAEKRAERSEETQKGNKE